MFTVFQNYFIIIATVNFFKTLDMRYAMYLAKFSFTHYNPNFMTKQYINQI